jgi:intein/homing endonuclease
MFTLDLSCINIENFRLPANEWLKNFKNTGVGFYIDAPKHSYEWIKYWDEQEYYCKNGYSVGGIRITGEHYFYLNFCQIQLKKGFGSEVLKGKKKVEKNVNFPDFWDSDWFYFTECELAREAGQHMIILKPRRRGYSYKNAAKCAYNYTFLRKSTSLIIAESSDYSEETMGMAVSYLDFLMKYTDFGKNRLINKPKDEILAGYEEVLADGTKTRSGSFSRLLAMTAKNNASVARGKDANVILFEEAGSFSNLKATYAATRPTVEEGLGVSGQIFVFGTGGDFSAGIVDFDEMFYNPEPYNFRAYQNIWEEGMELNKIGYFLPDYYSKGGFISEKGESQIEEAKIYIEGEIENKKRTSKDPNAVDVMLAEFPRCVEENQWISNENLTFKIKDFPNSTFSGEKETFKITTKLGFTTILTEDHPIYNGNKYIELKDLNIGDKISLLPFEYSNVYQKINIKTKLKCSSYDVTIDEDWALFIGLYLGDGSFYSRNKEGELEIAFDLKDQSSINWCRDFFISKFKIPSKRIIGDKKGGYRLRVYGKELLPLFESLDLIEDKLYESTVGSQGKKRKINVPDYIFKSPKSVVASFLKGIFDSDGCVYSSTTGVGMYSKYKTFITQIQQLLTGFNIFCKQLSQTKKAGDGHLYTGNSLWLNSANTKLFKDNIGFLSTRKQQILESKKYPRLKENILIDSINSIEPYGIKPCYDLTTNKGYFTAQGIWVHNCPKEAFIKSSSNIFPKAELQAQINYIKSSKIDESLGVCGELVDKDGEIIFNPSDKAKPIDSFPLKKDSDREGCFVQYQAPYKEENRVPNNLYYIGHDPYGVDSEKGESLGALFVFKQVNNISQPDDLIVAEYVARPSSGQDEYNRIMVMIAKYYNAKIGFENDRGNVIQYCRTNKVLGWLQEEADIYDKGEKVSNSLSRGYGMSMSNLKKKQQGCLYLRDWLLCRRGVDPSGKIKLNLNMIYSVPLLEELIKFEYDGNYDRVSACIIAMYYQKQIESKSIDRPQYVYNTDPFFTKFDSLGNFNSNY